MFDERAFLAQVEGANADELANLVRRPSAEEEKALRAYLGDERYQRLHGQALRRSISWGLGQPKGNVVVIPGIMGSELSAFDRAGGREPIWFKVLRILAGRFDRLRLGTDGRTEYNPQYDVRATGILKRSYGELLLSLSERWNVRAFWFDWRKDLNIAAAELEAQLSGWFGDQAPVHLVAHSMGGLVARTFIKKYPKRWEAMQDQPSQTKLGGRLILLGTPNQGSFAIPQILTGLESTVKWLTLLDPRHEPAHLLATLSSFVSLYQMLPSPLVMDALEPLYRSETYGDFVVPQCHLDNALKHHIYLSDVVDPERMIYVAGCNQPTFSNLTDCTKLNSIDAYEVTLQGDGCVPHALGRLAAPNGEPVPTYYLEESHGNLTSNSKLLAALDELLEEGRIQGWSDTPPVRRSGLSEAATSRNNPRDELLAIEQQTEQRLRVLVGRMRTRSAEANPTTYVGFNEREAEEIVTRNFLSYRQPEASRLDKPSAPFKPAHIEIGLVWAGIDKVHELPPKGDSPERPDEIRAQPPHRVLPIDAIAVGHYLGVKPVAAELALDRAISQSLPYRVRRTDDNLPIEADLLLTQYSERGIIRGELGQPFFLIDPRPGGGENGTTPERVIAIAGMGVPGRFGTPELKVLVRELCWSLGRMGKRHLATVLIGAGNGNIVVRDAVSAWIRGIKHAITGSFEEEHRHLERITFVESDPRRIRLIQDAILDEIGRLEKNRLTVDFKRLSEDELEALKDEEHQWTYQELQQEWERRSKRRVDVPNRVPTRITLGLERGIYRFGAITEVASVPEREIPVDPDLVMRANDELAAEWDRARQHERGHFLERLLLPDDLRSQLYTAAPLVLLLDAATARIHWEIITQSDLPALAGADHRDGDFLGTSRGLTRQLRTLFAPPPEPPPPPRRILRVLVVADPAADAHLPGAEEEGVEIADLFESFNKQYEAVSDNRVEVVRLFGPHEATRTNVLRHLMLRSYDVLHFAGHCQYNEADPASSGWIFSAKKKEYLTANELKRIDRIPKFVFSNACESGITPDRSEERSVDLAPTFAEAFFARGVSNFVCTAWPVDDTAARQFALHLYAGLLGLAKVGDSGNRHERPHPAPMHVAMRQARLAISDTPGGIRTWGAYQHYGNPYLCFFDATTMLRQQKATG